MRIKEIGNSMDEAIWRSTQLIIWVIGLQTAFIGSVMAFLWARMGKLDGKIDKNSDEITKLNTKISEEINKLDAKLSDKINKLDTKISEEINQLDAKLSDRIDKLDTKLSDRIDKLDVKVTDIDKRLFGVETLLHMKDCCMLKDDRQLKKAE